MISKLYTCIVLYYITITIVLYRILLISRQDITGKTIVFSMHCQFWDFGQYCFHNISAFKLMERKHTTHTFECLLYYLFASSIAIYIFKVSFLKISHLFILHKSEISTSTAFRRYFEAFKLKIQFYSCLHSGLHRGVCSYIICLATLYNILFLKYFLENSHLHI